MKRLIAAVLATLAAAPATAASPARGAAPVSSAASGDAAQPAVIRAGEEAEAALLLAGGRDRPAWRRIDGRGGADRHGRGDHDKHGRGGNDWDRKDWDRKGWDRSDRGSDWDRDRGWSVDRDGRNPHAWGGDRRRDDDHGNRKRRDGPRYALPGARRGQPSWAQPRWDYPPQAGYWRVGERPPPHRWVAIRDHRGHHLPPPPRGHVFVVLDGEVALLTAATGVIAGFLQGR